MSMNKCDDIKPDVERVRKNKKKRKEMRPSVEKEEKEEEV